ncbi:MAG: DUF4426 domain-containing protein [Halioglobus sp.]|nr:DUF4426 domain-containing protein [Halioglobus sp.]
MLLLLSSLALAQGSERFGPYELHSSVVNTTFLDPQVAAAYGITRGEKRAIVNIALREQLESGQTIARKMTLQGYVRDLLQRQQKLEFREIVEGSSIYYIAEFTFINEEWRTFDIGFIPDGASERYNHSFKRQLYTD